MGNTQRTTQLLKSNIDTVWNFISSPENLALINSKYMGFKIISDKEDIKKMYPGQIIEYYVTPVIGIKINWVTQITHLEHHHNFVDEQRFCTYAFWHHKHFIKEVPAGIEMIDILHYKVPFGFIGKIVNTLFIRHKIKEIFDCRFNKLEQLFNHGK